MRSKRLPWLLVAGGGVEDDVLLRPLEHVRQVRLVEGHEHLGDIVVAQRQDGHVVVRRIVGHSFRLGKCVRVRVVGALASNAPALAHSFRGGCSSLPRGALSAGPAPPRLLG